MDSKEKEDHVKSLITSREMLLKLQQNIETATTGPSASTSADLQNLSNEIQKHLMKTAATAQDPNKPDPSKATSHIKDGITSHLIFQYLIHSFLAIYNFFLCDNFRLFRRA